MSVENIVQNLYKYIVDNDFNGFYDYLIDIFKNSTELKCNLIVETFLNNLNYEKFYNMYAPVIKSVLDKELDSRKTISFESYKNFIDEGNDVIVNEHQVSILNNLKIQLANKDLEGFRKTLAHLINEIKEQSELKAILSSVSRIIESIKDDKPTYDECKTIFQEIRNASPLWLEELDTLNNFINNKGFTVLDNNTEDRKK